MDAHQFTHHYLTHLQTTCGVTLDDASTHDLYTALARTIRGQLITQRHAATKPADDGHRHLAYFSAEYLLGPQTSNALLATGLTDTARQALAELNLDFDAILAAETEPGLGNGGLGRLAACFMDSLATLDIPATGYGIRYDYGIFRQTFVGGEQVEQPDTWLTLGSPWEISHPERAIHIGLGGTVTEATTDNGTPARTWNPARHVLAVPCDYLVPGYRTDTVNTLRLWSARATDAFNLTIFNSGDFEAAVAERTAAESISHVLYPEDSTPQGKELRLTQQYFFCAASLHDIIDNHMAAGRTLSELPHHVTIQLNDTHPVIAIPELLRLLLDEYSMTWDDAWDITRNTFNYTCHTLLPEALEIWPIDVIGRLLPRHLELIYAINQTFLDEVRKETSNELLVRSMSLIQEHPFRAVRMAHLATVGSRMVNGVAALHSELLRTSVLKDFSDWWPEKFTNVTNGVTPRRFIALANPRLTELINDTIGDDWITNLPALRELEDHAHNPGFITAFQDIKADNKKRLAQHLEQRDNIELPADAIYDVMVKRLHEYKRQSLKILHVVSLYAQVKAGIITAESIEPRVVVFGAKAAPGYRLAKETISLINAVARTINNAPELQGRLSIAFPANYNVTLAQTLIPAADLSEQISLAGKEASGTGNMKFALNGALTIGTLDGANVEIRDLVGEENFFLFGMTEPEVEQRLRDGYKPYTHYESHPDLKRAIDLIASGEFANGDTGRYESLVSDWLWNDRFMALADFDDYVRTQEEVTRRYQQRDQWTTSAILNVARSGFFSSDRSIQDYQERIWQTPLA
ncbi:glycogen/starch/alpha-glucan phosphorylase [Jonesia quinghaiensis]|uniref:glycogen/starch/alpha-glucan phosphorylase n=1 Tax=Jonesia quinghaiensis TaxID=262806 RepID=UPI0003FBBC5E|nr:glycogen/starch/alpha-glucan phosphorylase [Jonesia quinghaiensis]